MPPRPAAASAGRRVARPAAGEHGRGQVQGAQPGHGPGQKGRVVAELGVGVAGHHFPDAGQAGGSGAGSRPEVRRTAPPWPARPNQMSKPAPFTARARPTSSMVLVAMASMPPASASAPASTSRQPPAAAAVRSLPVVDPAERVNLGEKVHEGGHQQAFPAAGGGKPGHERHRATPIVVGGLYELAQRGRGVGDVGVGEQEPFRAGCRRQGRLHALGHGPGLARPAGRPGPAG